MEGLRVVTEGDSGMLPRGVIAVSTLPPCTCASVVLFLLSIPHLPDKPGEPQPCNVWGSSVTQLGRLPPQPHVVAETPSRRRQAGKPRVHGFTLPGTRLAIGTWSPSSAAQVLSASAAFLVAGADAELIPMKQHLCHIVTLYRREIG